MYHYTTTNNAINIFLDGFLKPIDNQNLYFSVDEPFLSGEVIFKSKEPMDLKEFTLSAPPVVSTVVPISIEKFDIFIMNPKEPGKYYKATIVWDSIKKIFFFFIYFNQPMIAGERDG